MAPSTYPSFFSQLVLSINDVKVESSSITPPVESFAYTLASLTAMYSQISRWISFDLSREVLVPGHFAIDGAIRAISEQSTMVDHSVWEQD